MTTSDEFVGLDRIEEVFGYKSNGKPNISRWWIERHWREEGMPGRVIGNTTLFHVQSIIEWWRKSVENAIAV